VTSESMHAHQLTSTIWQPTLVLIAQAMFILECSQTYKVPDASDHPTMPQLPPMLKKHC